MVLKLLLNEFSPIFKFLTQFNSKLLAETKPIKCLFFLFYIFDVIFRFATIKAWQKTIKLLPTHLRSFHQFYSYHLGFTRFPNILITLYKTSIIIIIIIIFILCNFLLCIFQRAVRDSARKCACLSVSIQTKTRGFSGSASSNHQRIWIFFLSNHKELFEIWHGEARVWVRQTRQNERFSGSAYSSHQKIKIFYLANQKKNCLG